MVAARGAIHETDRITPRGPSEQDKFAQSEIHGPGIGRGSKRSGDLRIQRTTLCQQRAFRLNWD
jgi:hypothetical protein